VTCVARQALGPAARGESPQDAVEPGKPGFTAHSSPRQRDGPQGLSGTSATPQPNGTTAGDRQDEPQRRFERLAKPMQHQRRDGFDGARDRARGVAPRRLVRLKDLCELEGGAVCAGTARRAFVWRCGRCRGHRVFLSAGEDVAGGVWEAKRPRRRGALNDRGEGAQGVQHPERRGVMAHRNLQSPA
jgi:hypothetical protein